MKTLAVILVELGKPLVLAELEVQKLKAGQVLVEILFSGVCHTQVLECRGYRGEDKYLPHCLGHEGSGIVREIGPEVSKVKVGDAVILSWMKGTGMDVSQTLYQWNGRTVNAGGITTFSRYSVISENRLTKVSPSFPMREAALLGCAVPTGLGVLFNTARARKKQSVAIFGVGGIGLCVVAGAKILGLSPIIAVDVRRDRLEVAKAMGADFCILSSGNDAVDEILRLSPTGIDYAIDASGRPSVMKQALRSVRRQGGDTIIVGNARYGEMLEIDPRELNLGKSLLGTWGGDNFPDRDFPKYLELVRSGQLDLSPLLSENYPLTELNQAIDDLENGKCIRPLIDMSLT